MNTIDEVQRQWRSTGKKHRLFKQQEIEWGTQTLGRRNRKLTGGRAPITSPATSPRKTEMGHSRKNGGGNNPMSEVPDGITRVAFKGAVAGMPQGRRPVAVHADGGFGRKPPRVQSAPEVTIKGLSSSMNSELQPDEKYRFAENQNFQIGLPPVTNISPSNLKPIQAQLMSPSMLNQMAVRSGAYRQEFRAAQEPPTAAQSWNSTRNLESLDLSALSFRSSKKDINISPSISGENVSFPSETQESFSSKFFNLK